MSIDNHAIDVTVHLAVVHEPLVDAAMAQLLDECPDGNDVLPVHKVAGNALDGARRFLAALPQEVVHDMLLVAMWDHAVDDAKERIGQLDGRLIVGEHGYIEATRPEPRCPTPDLHATYHRRSETYRRQVANGVAVPSVPGRCDWCSYVIPGGVV